MRGLSGVLALLVRPALGLSDQDVEVVCQATATTSPATTATLPFKLKICSHKQVYCHEW